MAVAVALAATLHSLSTDEFDGLNNMLQIPFALPWFLLPIPAATGWSYNAMAWVDAGTGWLNGLIIASWIEYRRRRASLPSGPRTGDPGWWTTRWLDAGIGCLEGRLEPRGA